MMLTYMTILSVKDSPRFRIDLPDCLKVGDRVNLNTTLTRTNATGRTEKVTLVGDFQVTEVHFKAGGAVTSQTVSVQGLGAATPWRAVKSPKRKLPLAVQPRQVIP